MVHWWQNSSPPSPYSLRLILGLWYQKQVILLIPTPGTFFSHQRPYILVADPGYLTVCLFILKPRDGNNKNSWATWYVTAFFGESFCQINQHRTIAIYFRTQCGKTTTYHRLSVQFRHGYTDYSATTRVYRSEIRVWTHKHPAFRPHLYSTMCV